MGFLIKIVFLSYFCVISPIKQFLESAICDYSSYLNLGHGTLVRYNPGWF